MDTATLSQLGFVQSSYIYISLFRDAPGYRYWCVDPLLKRLYVTSCFCAIYWTETDLIKWHMLISIFHSEIILYYIWKKMFKFILDYHIYLCFSCFMFHFPLGFLNHTTKLEMLWNIRRFFRFTGNLHKLKLSNLWRIWTFSSDEWR